MGIMILALLGAITLGSQGEVLVATVEATINVLESIENQKTVTKIEDKVIKSLIKKYGDGNFEIIKFADNESYSFIDLEIKTSYMNDSFQISVIQDGTIMRDNFIDVYAKEKWNVTNLEEFAIQKAIERNNSLYFSYDMRFERVNSNYMGFNDYEEGRLPTIEDINARVNLGRNEDLLIGSSYTKNDLDKFTNNIIAAYKIYADYNSSDKFFDGTMFFKFENGVNPFCNPNKDKLGAYVDGGYIREAGSIYLIYLNPVPLQIDK